MCIQGILSWHESNQITCCLILQANALKKDNVKIVVVGVGDQVDTELMMLIADDDSFLMVDDFDQLGDTALGDVRDRVRNTLFWTLIYLNVE